VPVPEVVRAACGLLGLDPLSIANEGRVVAVVRPERADQALAAMQGTAGGARSVRIGTVTSEHPGVVVARTGIGGTRVVDLPLAEQLPRIC
jgi:hydrogenase expression/formation protein HypE